MRLILARHAESLQTIQKTISGPKSCRGLTGRGFEQAEVLAERLQRTGEAADCAVFLTSPVLRARQTAAVLARRLPLPEAVEDLGLCEVLPGEADGMAWAAYEARYGRFDLVAQPERPFAPGGESWSGYLARVRSGLNRYAAEYAGKTVLAVTHAGFIVAALLVLFDIPRPGTGTYFDPDFTGLNEWQCTGGKWRLVRCNDTCHLKR